MIELQNGDAALYSSNKDIDGEQNVQKIYEPATPVEYAINTAPKGTTTLYSPQTIASNNIIIQPEITEPTKAEAVRINSEKLYNAYGSGSEQIIKDIQNNVPLDPDVAEHLITSNIITQSKVIKKKTTIPLQSTPVKMGQLPFDSKTGITIKPKKISTTNLINNLTNFIYKLIYEKNG